MARPLHYWGALLTASSIAGLLGVVSAAQARGGWQSFRWYDARLGSETLLRAVLMVPARFEGLPGEHWFQLDLGADFTAVFGGKVRDIHPGFPQRRLPDVRVSGSIAGVTVENEPLKWIDGFRATATEGQPSRWWVP